MGVVHLAILSKEFPIVLGTPVRRADPSGRPTRPNTISHRGVIQVINAATGAVLGYVSNSSMKRAQLRHQPSTDTALIVTFNTDSTGSGTGLALDMTVCFELVSVSKFSYTLTHRTRTQASVC